jgi:rod shape-determining protein MreB and related proteins
MKPLIVYIRIRRKEISLRSILHNQEGETFADSPQFAIHTESDRVVAVGDAALMYDGRADYKVVQAFQHPRVCIHNMDVTVKLMHLLLDRAVPRKQRYSMGMLKRQIHLVYHLLQPWEGGITDIERRAFADLTRSVGGTHYFLWDSPAELTDSQVMEIAERSVQGVEQGLA